MENLIFFNLNLGSPLFYAPADCPAFSYTEWDCELLLAFTLPQAQSFEPDAASFLPAPAWIGKTGGGDDDGTGSKTEGRGNGAAGSAADSGAGRALQALSLPAGLYFFSQKRESLDKERCTELAIEVQKEGLWQRKKLGDQMYIRYLYEDNSPVTQVFREIKE